MTESSRLLISLKGKVMNDYMFSNGQTKPFIICKCGSSMSPMMTPNPLVPAHSCNKCGEVYSPLMDSFLTAMNMLSESAGMPPGMVMFTNRGLLVATQEKEVER